MVGERVVAQLRGDLFGRLVTLSLDFHAARRVGELVSRLSSDVTLVRTMLTQTMTSLLSSVIGLVGSVIILFTLSPTLLLIVLLLAPALIAVARPSAATADAIYDQLAERLATDAYRPRALYERFRIEVLATTDDPCDDLAAHAALAADPTWPGRVIPTFRPDRYLEPAQPGWADAVAQLGEAADVDTGDYAGYVAGAGGPPPVLRRARRRLGRPQPRRRRHRPAGAGARRSGSTGSRWPATRPPSEAAAFRRHMLLEMARMSCDDGLVMTLHPGVRRNHHRPTFARFGADTGHDIPVRDRVHRRAAPAAGALRHASRTSPGRCSRSTRPCSPASSRRWPGFYPVGLPRRAVVVPRRPGRRSAASAGGHRDRRLLPDLRLHRRHPRVLLDPRAARHVPPRSTPASSPSWSPSTGSTRTRRWRPRRPRRRPARARCSSCEPRRGRPLSRAAGDGRAAAPVRLVHLGLGNFFRAHQAWYTDRAPDAAEWGIAAFTGRSPTSPTR